MPLGEGYSSFEEELAALEKNKKKTRDPVTGVMRDDPNTAKRIRDLKASIGRMKTKREAQIGKEAEKEFRAKGRELYETRGGGEFREAALQNIQQLQAMQRGEGSVAMEQARQQAQAATGRGMGMAASAGRSQRGLATRAAIQQAGVNQMTAAGEGVLGSLKERQMATDALGQATEAGRRGDLGAQELGLGVQTGMEEFQATQRMAANQEIAAQDEARRRRELAVRGMGFQAAGAGTAAMIQSDEDSKKNISSGSKDVESFMDNLKAYSYEYKDKANGAGQRLGPMAQDIEKSAMGRKMVSGDPKEVDLGKMTMALAASVAELNKKLNKKNKKG